MSANGISEQATKEIKQLAKLNLAQRKRQGYLVGDQAGSASFNGTSQYLTAPSTGTNAAFTFTGDFTVEAWYYPTSVTGDHAIFCLGTETTNRYVWYVQDGGSIGSNLYGDLTTTYTSSVGVNVWTHIAVVRSGSTVKVYINGTASVTTSTEAGTIGNGVLKIGSDSSGATPFAGNISNFRVVKGTALYTSTFTPDPEKLPAVTNTSFLLNTVYGLNFLVDNSANALTVTNTGTALASSFSPTTTNTVDTDAAFYRERNVYDITQLPTQYSDNDVVDNPNLDVFTVSPGVIQTGIRKVTYTGYHEDNVAFTDTATVTATTTATNFVIASIAENTTVLYTGYLLATYTGTWTFTITSDDASYLWIGSTAVSGYTTSNELAGASWSGPGTGTISLTAGEYYPVRLLYGNGPSGGNLNLTYAHTGQTATNDFTGKLFSPGVKLVEGRPWVAVAPVTTGSLLIPDTSSRVTMSPGLAVGSTTTSPFTVEGWFYSTVNPGTDSGPVLLSTTTGSGTPAYYKALTVNVNSSTQVVVDSNGAAATAFDFAQTMVVNAWYYLAVSRDTSGYIQVWMAKKGDATAAASTTGRYDSAGAGAAWTLTGLSDCIGSFVPANRFTTGYISNLRVTNTNLYTTTDATIAVPTAPFTEVTGTVLLVNDTTLTDQTGNQTLTAVGTAAGNALNPF